MPEKTHMGLKAREIVIPLVVGLAVALLQAVFSGPDLIRLILYFFVGLGLAGVGLLVYRFLRDRTSRVSVDDLRRTARVQAERRDRSQPVTSSAGEKARVWADVKPEDLLAIDNLQNLTRNERDRLLEPYVGQWLRIEGIVDDVQGRPDDAIVFVYISERDHRVTAEFKDEKQRASSLRKGIPIGAIGSFRNAQGYVNTIYLTDCEFAQIDSSVRLKSEPQAQKPVAAQEALPETGVVAPFNALLADHGREFSGADVGKTETFRITKMFGFKWSPSAGIVIGGLHGTLNGIPHTWTFDNNMNPYYPAKYAPPPDVPGNYYFSIDNIEPGTPWTITVLYDSDDRKTGLTPWDGVLTNEDEVGPQIDFQKQSEVRLRVKPLQGTQWRFGFKFSRNAEFSKGRYSSGYPLWHLQKEQDSNDLAFTYYDELSRGRGALLCSEYGDKEIDLLIRRKDDQLMITADCNPSYAGTFDARSHRFAMLTAWADGRPFRIGVQLGPSRTES
jgi:hypothetical protein